MNFIDKFLDQITMYRLVLYYLTLLILVAVVLSFLGVLPYNPISILFTTAIITFFCWVFNTLFSKIFKAPSNIESTYITAFILSLIITPTSSFFDLPFLIIAPALAMASKYILSIHKKHLFNPAALAVVITGFLINQQASWWVGSGAMFPFLILGLFIVRKIRRFSLVASFLITTLLILLLTSILRDNDPFLILKTTFLSSPLLFFAFIMLTEPQTSPLTKRLQSIYGALVGLLSSLTLGSFYLTPEQALLVGNVFSYIVSSKQKLILTLSKKVKLAPDIYEFIFKSNQKLNFLPGQYMEWTLAHKNSDTRGVRRFFTIASSPSEPDLKIGIKVFEKSSSFKQALLNLTNQKVIASNLSGDFVLPKDQRKLAFIAGGIGVTPFRSIVKYLLDTNQKRDIILFYSNKLSSDIVYKDIFTKAEKDLGIKTIYTLTDTTNIPNDWKGKTGYVDENMIKTEIPDYKQRIFYISGPHSMVTAFESTISKLGVKKNQIKVDFFPGYV